MPSFIFGSVTGVTTAVVICLYKLCATYVIELSMSGYERLREAPIWLILVVPALFLTACLFARVYRKYPNMKGGGIPTSIAALRGILPIHGLRNLVGVFTISLSMFLLGVPLGNEGPSVQMGTDVGKMCMRSFPKRSWAWERYTMTGGACAGFAVATGAPISGILFSVEEAHQRISPMLLMVSATSVMVAKLTTDLLCRILPIHAELFVHLSLIALTPRDVWIPFTVGIAVGLFAVLFLKYYYVIRGVAQRILKSKMADTMLIFTVFILTLIFGLFSKSFISTGHDLMLSLFDGNKVILVLLMILFIRSTLTLLANSAGLTGGLFVPIMTLGALISAIIGRALVSVLGIEHNYFVIILVLGITACIAAMMKMPLTAIVFAVEALGCYENVIYVIVVAVVSYVITEFFGVKSINDVVIEHRTESLHEGEEAVVAEVFLTVLPGSFAVGKQIRDIFWPSNTFVLSVKSAHSHHAEVDGHGGRDIHAADVLHVRYSTYDQEQTVEALLAIVGEQEIEIVAVDRA